MKIRAARNCFAARAMPAKNLHQIKKRTGEACKFKAQIHWFYSLNMQMRGVLVAAFIIIALAPWRRELADLRNITGKSFSLYIAYLYYVPYSTPQRYEEKKIVRLLQIELFNHVTLC